MKLDFKITNLLTNTPVMEFFVLPSLHFQYIDLLRQRSYLFNLELFAWRMTLIVRLPEKRDKPAKEAGEK